MAKDMHIRHDRCGISRLRSVQGTEHRRPYLLEHLLFPTVRVCGSTFLQFTANLTPGTLSDCRRHDAMCWSCDNENKGHTWKPHMHDMSQPIGRLGTAAERFASARL
jgi:hypothetical protein